MQNYSFFQKLLHKFFFNIKLINLLLYELEKFFFINKVYNYNNYKHIFITGLPRSGTTPLLNCIFKSEMFASLTYENMPYLFAPNISLAINVSENFEKKIRFHNDQIYFDLKSPEAFDQPFLNLTKNNLNEFSNYVNLILHSKKKERYLSKNNKNYIRISELKKIFPNAIFLIPIRYPINHSNSLFNQHKNFSSLQKKDKFILDYMNFLDHHEFGLNHKEWFKPIKYTNYNELNYWLEQWYLFYNNIYDKFINQKNVHILIYENLFDDFYRSKITNSLDLKNINLDLENKNINLKNLDIDNDLKLKSINLYNKFLNSNHFNTNYS
tara:strand:+ start:4281 stop:5255 length:975 start_codon:yes stop_codon:yes gene_type:complete